MNPASFDLKLELCRSYGAGIILSAVLAINIRLLRSEATALHLILSLIPTTTQRRIVLFIDFTQARHLIFSRSRFSDDIPKADALATSNDHDCA